MLICATVLIAVTLSALMAVVVDVAYQAITQRRWPAELPPMAVGLSVLAVLVGATVGSSLV